MKAKRPVPPDGKTMLAEATWAEFTDAGLFWWINRSLHLFGWALVKEVDGYGTPDEKIARVYPARCRFRGFDEAVEAEGFVRLSEHLRDNAAGNAADAAKR